MVIKIFYFFVALFSVALAFLSLQTPYVGEFFDNNTSISNMQMSNITDFDMNSSLIYSEITAKDAKRYDKFDEFYDVLAKEIRNDTNHTLSSKKALLKDDILKLFDNATYTNTDGIYYNSKEIMYNQKEQILQSDTPFFLSQDENNITGDTIKYDIKNKLTYSTKVHGWYHKQDD